MLTIFMHIQGMSCFGHIIAKGALGTASVYMVSFRVPLGHASALAQFIADRTLEYSGIEFDNVLIQQVI